MRVGFIGVGNIGKPMAEQIVASGFDLIVYDVRKEAAISLVEDGALWARSPREVAEQCEILCTCLPGPKEMEEVTLGRNGIIEGFRRDSIYIDHTTNSPTMVRKVCNALNNQGISMLDAPVSGGMEGARTRKLTILVGGDADIVEKSRPVLEAIGNNVIHVGDIGNGCICKLAHNSASFTVRQAIIECLTLGVKAGVDPTTLITVFQQSALGNAFDLQQRLPDTLFKGDFEPRFSLKLSNKDMSLATDLAHLNNVPMPLTEITAQEMKTAISKGWENMDGSIAMTLQEERANVQIRIDEPYTKTLPPKYH